MAYRAAAVDYSITNAGYRNRHYLPTIGAEILSESR